MPRYAAFLRGVSPMNAKMPELKRCFEEVGFENVKTVLATGNVVFDARKTSDASLEKKIEAAMREHLKREFLTIVRSIDALKTLLEEDPFQDYRLNPGSKRIVTFLRAQPKTKPKLPLDFGSGKIHGMKDLEVFTTYVPSPKGPEFMVAIEKAFQKEVTTRTWDTVIKVSRA